MPHVFIGARHPIHLSCVFSSVCFSYLSFFCLNLVPLPLPCGFHRSNIPCAHRQMRSLAFWAEITLLTGYEPNVFDVFHNSETTEIILQEQSSPRTCVTRKLTTRPSAERSLHHCSFRSEKNQRAVDKHLILYCRWFVVCLSCKNGETRA